MAASLRVLVGERLAKRASVQVRALVQKSCYSHCTQPVLSVWHSYLPLLSSLHNPFQRIEQRKLSSSGSQQEVEDYDQLDSLYQQIDLEIKGNDPAVIKSYEKFVTMTANELDIHIGNIFTPPKVLTRYNLLKSVHIYKKHQVHYEIRTHYKVIQVKFLTGSTADTFLEYIQRNLPEGMAMKVTKHRLEKIPDHLKPPKLEDTENNKLI